MAVEQTLVLTKQLFCNHKAPLTNYHIPSVCPIARSLSFRRFESKRDRLLGFAFNGGLKCSMDYNNNNDHYERVVDPQYPRPSEIQWKKELCNSLQLIGTVATPVQIKYLSSGKVLAWSRLAVKKTSTETTWINLTFWDELAHVASLHVEKGNQIYVSGRVVSDTVENDDGKQQTYYKVVVQELNFVERGFSSVSLSDGDSNSLTPGRKPSNFTGNSTGNTEELWQAFFANPADWWDNRKNKRNPNYPDFKHKDTGEALWVEGRYNPSWVKSQLAILDSRMESLQDQNASMQMNFMTGDRFTPF
ncbi:unnamed protein product [Ilex paraguariensis]|uniref:Uncharacterized protein n=1 Tax=Ilex paraguariensis TaxID=185542 RepID=A0ABC8RL63_9AQUA